VTESEIETKVVWDITPPWWNTPVVSLDDIRDLIDPDHG
jgi:hypothetical protein